MASFPYNFPRIPRGEFRHGGGDNGGAGNDVRSVDADAAAGGTYGGGAPTALESHKRSC